MSKLFDFLVPSFPHSGIGMIMVPTSRALEQCSIITVILVTITTCISVVCGVLVTAHPRAGTGFPRTLQGLLSIASFQEKFRIVRVKVTHPSIKSVQSDLSQKAAQLCPTLRDPMDWSPPGSSVLAPLSLPCPSPGDLPDPGIEPRSPALQADSLPFELPRNRRE